MDVASLGDMKPVPSEKGEQAVVETAGRLPPEDRLLWLVCRAELDAVRRRLLRETVEGALAWDRVIDKGRYHRLLDLLHHHLHRCGHLAAVPAAQRARLEESRAQARGMQARLDAALAHCTTALEAASVEHVIVKGPTLQVLYPDDVVRAAGDLDFLVHEEDLGAATAALGRAGFALQTPVPEGLTTAETVRYCHTFEQLRFHGDDGAEVELHFRLHNYGPPSVREPLWDSVACWRAADGSARAGIGLEELFLYLVSHLNLHAFGRILWYYDVAEFYRTWRRHIDWASLARMAGERRLGASFYQTLHWTVELLWPEWDLEPGLAPLRPSPLRRAAFDRLWRRDEVFALASWIRPFDASRYYLLGSDSPLRKAAYLRQVLLPPRTWLAAHLGCAARPGVLLRYLASRRRERRDWGRITRRDELLRT